MRRLTLPHKIILISGPVCSGKTRLANNLRKKFDAHVIRTRDILAKSGSIKRDDRLALQVEGERLDKKTEGRWVLEKLSQVASTAEEDLTFVVDSVKITEQISHIRSAYRSVTHIHLSASLEELERRYKRRYRKKHDVPSYAKVRENLTEQYVDSLGTIADVVINTDRCKEGDILVRAASRISLYGKNNTGYVDVIVGGQYGSEGKGQIAAFLANEYDLHVRVGGPNAGHTVYEDPKPYIHHQLPSATRRCNAHLLLGPGMVLNVEKLLSEIADCEVEYDRLSIDPHVMIICEEDIEAEDDVKENIGSTRQGVGQATARRITERGKASVLMAKDIPELKPFIRTAVDILTKTFARSGKVLLEGTQGTGLSIYHGMYPYVTSRDTTVSGCLAEAGIPPSRVRRVVMVCRTYPIRVESPKKGTSGPMGDEIDWNIISKRSCIDLAELQENEITSTTHRKRRVCEFDWELLQKATSLNRPSDIALTFTDYISIKNREAMRFEQLTQDTLNFIEEIEHVAKARVSLIGTGFNPRSIIDRREW